MVRISTATNLKELINQEQHQPDTVVFLSCSTLAV